MGKNINVVLDNDLDETRRQGKDLLIFRSGNVVEGEEPKDGEKDTRVYYPFTITITKDAEMERKGAKIHWVATEPDNSETLEIKIKNIFNF